MDRVRYRDVGDEPNVRAALAASHLGVLPVELLDPLVGAGSLVDLPAGTTFHREGDVNRHFEVVVGGLVRVYVTAPDGRTMTVRYCRPGAILGALSLYRPSFSMPADVQALVPTLLLSLPPDLVADLASHDVRVARTLLDELSERVDRFIAEIRDSSFATVRQRLARHLLDLGAEHQRGAELIAPVSQQELAEAIGSVREVVVRVLRQLRSEGIVDTGRRGITIRSPERLLAESGEIRTTPGGGAGWNPGS